MTGRWRVIAATVVTTVVLVAATSLWFGADIWLEYVRKVMPQQQWLHDQWRRAPGADGRIGLRQCAQCRPAARSLLGGAGRQCRARALAMVVWTFWRRRDPVLSMALFVTATFLFSPWMLNYDMVVFGFVVALLRQRDDNTPADHRLALVVWTLPVTHAAASAPRTSRSR